jgi:ABC-type branched-subunit amino acid transport system substrate-binding protein
VNLRSGRWARFLALLAVLMLVAAACGGDGDDGDDSGSATTRPGETTEPDEGPGGDPEPAPGFDGSTIRVGVVTPQTGIAAIIGNPLTNGNRAYFERVNSEGGIAGKYRVELTVVDSQYQAATGVQVYNSIKNDVVAFVQILGTPVVNAILPLLGDDNIVASPASLDSFWVPEQQLLALGTPYQIEAVNAMDWWFNQEGNEGDRACVLYQNDPYGEAGLEGVEFAAEEIGFEVGAKVAFAATDTDLSAQVNQLRSANCEVVFFVALPTATGGVMGAAEQIGFTPQWIGQAPSWIGAFAGNTYMQEHYVRAATGPDWGDTSSEGMAQMLEDLEAYTPDQAPDTYFAFGYAQAWALAQVLERAVERGDLSREGIVAAMNSVGTLSSGGLLGDYEYGPPEDRVPPRSTRIFRVDPDAPGGLSSITDEFTSEAAEAFEFDF